MLDVFLEITRTVSLFAVFLFIYRIGKKRAITSHKGWNLIIIGFSFILFGSLIDITDNFASLNHFVIIGDTPTEALLEKFIGFLGGPILLAMGLVQWIPGVQHLQDEINLRKQTEKALRHAHDDLELRVKERTTEYQTANLQLKSEAAKRIRTAEALARLKNQYDLILRSAGEGIYGVDTGGEITFVNPAAARMIGWRSTDLTGRFEHDVLHHATSAGGACSRDQSPVSHVTGDGDVHHVYDEVFWRKDDTSFPVEYVRAPIFEDGTVKGAVVIFHDISDRKRAERDLVAAKEQAEFANQAKSAFLANMSHELRTPLNAIIGFSDIIVSQTFGPIGNANYNGYIKDINGSAHLLLSLINDILDLSKIESTSVELVEEKVEIASLVGSALALVQQGATVDGVDLITRLPDCLPDLRADERKLKQILLNLLTNAIKFTEPGGTVEISASCAPNNDFVLQVADSGIGMAPEDIATAMTQFGQVDNRLNRNHSGTGLGLPLARSLMVLHGGTLVLQSALGVGSTVTLRFPATRVIEPPHRQDRQMGSTG